MQEKKRNENALNLLILIENFLKNAFKEILLSVKSVIKSKTKLAQQDTREKTDFFRTGSKSEKRFVVVATRIVKLWMFHYS